MRILSSVCALLFAGCSFWQPAPHRNDPIYLHGYKPLPQAGQVINVNADPDGDAWIVGGLVLPSLEELEAVPVLSLPMLGGLADALPERVDNSTKQYFRGIFAQKHGSCAQASGIAYVYGYEVNRMRGVAATDAAHKYPTHWTYNFVNRGYDRGSWMMWGWEVGKSMGIPNAKAYGTETGYSLQHWPSDYVVYENAIDNKVNYYFVMKTSTKPTLDQVRRYLWNHGAEGREGGILSFAAGWSTGYAEARIPDGQYQAGKKLITSFGASVNHAVTFVGYDDKICYDFNQDGACTDDVDLNGDDKIDLIDRETGAFIMANSWGTRWGNDGFIFVPYRLTALDPKDGGIWQQQVYGVVPAADKDKTLVLRVTMQHDKRDQLKLMSRYIRDKDTNDNKEPVYYRYYGLQNSGGSYPLNGKDNGAVAFGLDLRTLLAKENMKKALDIGSVVDSLGGGVGKIASVEIVDYLNDVVFQAGDKDVPIERGRTVVETEWDPDGEPDPDPDPDPDPIQPCQVGPIARAGDDLVVGEYCTLVLDGTDSYDPDAGKIVKYVWRQLSGPQKLVIKDADKPKATVLIPEVDRYQRYQFNLTITDDDGYVDTDRVRIIVIDRFK